MALIRLQTGSACGHENRRLSPCASSKERETPRVAKAGKSDVGRIDRLDVLIAPRSLSFSLPGGCRTLCSLSVLELPSSTFVETERLLRSFLSLPVSFEKRPSPSPLHLRPFFPPLPFFIVFLKPFFLLLLKDDEALLLRRSRGVRQRRVKPTPTEQSRTRRSPRSLPSCLTNKVNRNPCVRLRGKRGGHRLFSVGTTTHRHSRPWSKKNRALSRQKT